MKIQNEDQVAARLESALYSAGRPLTVEELIKASGTESRQKTLDVLDSIIKKMKSTFTLLNCDFGEAVQHMSRIRLCGPARRWWWLMWSRGRE